MRIIGLTGEGLANAEYRVALPLRALAARGHVTQTFGCHPPTAIDSLMGELRRADVLHVWRLYQGPVRKALRVLQDEGVAIVWDNDDDMTNLPPGFATRGRYTVSTDQLARELRSVMSLADAVTTTSGELAKRFRRMGATHVTVIDNHIGEETVRHKVRAEGGRVVVGWVAGQEHRVDVKQMRLRSVLERVLHRNQQAEVVSVGLDLGLRSDRYRWIDWVPLSGLSGSHRAVRHRPRTAGEHLLQSRSFACQGQGVRGSRGAMARIAGRALPRPRRAAGRAPGSRPALAPQTGRADRGPRGTQGA